jgi:hypothetical protein
MYRRLMPVCLQEQGSVLNLVPPAIRRRLAQKRVEVAHQATTMLAPAHGMPQSIYAEMLEETPMLTPKSALTVLMMTLIMI